MTEIKIMSAGAVKVMVVALGADFERDSGIKLDLNFGTAGAQAGKIKAGEATDLVMVSQSGIQALDQLNLLKPGSIVDLASTVTGVIVRDGTPKPDISTPDAFIRAMMAAPSVAWTDPKAGGSGGIMFAAMLEKLGIADAINKKAVLCRRPRRLRHHLDQRGLAGQRRHHRRPAARRSQFQEHVFGCHSCPLNENASGAGLSRLSHGQGDPRALDRRRHGAGFLGPGRGRTLRQRARVLKFWPRESGRS